MRLSEHEKKVIIDSISEIDPKAHIFLFGSRANNLKQGGDIDILVISEHITFDHKLKIKKDLFNLLEEQRIDLVIKSSYDHPFVRLALQEAVRLR